MLLMVMMAVVVVEYWWWWDENKNGTADGKGSRPTSYIYPSLLSISERWKLTSYYSSVESHLQAFLNSEFEKHTEHQAATNFGWENRTERHRGNTQTRASPPVNESFPATHPQYDAFMNQNKSSRVTTQAWWHTGVPVLIQPKCLLGSKPVSNFSSVWDTEMFLNMILLKRILSPDVLTIGNRTDGVS